MENTRNQLSQPNNDRPTAEPGVHQKERSFYVLEDPNDLNGSLIPIKVVYAVVVLHTGGQFIKGLATGHFNSGDCSWYPTREQIGQWEDSAVAAFWNWWKEGNGRL